MADSVIWDWSTTASSNGTVGGGVNIAENCAMSGLNNGIRAVMAGAVGSLQFNTASGGDTYTATQTPIPGTYSTGSLYNLMFATANTSTASTLNLNSLGAVTIKAADGLNIGPGQLKGVGTLEYDGANLRLLTNGGQGPTAWTPADASGGSITITNNGSYYYQIGKLVILCLDITYPSTADSHQAFVTGLPVAANSTLSTNVFNALLFFQGGSVANAASLANGGIQFLSGSSAAILTNANLTGAHLKATIPYFTL